MCPLPRAALTAAFYSPDYLRFPGDTGSHGAPPIGVSSTMVLSFAAFSIGGVWVIALDGAPSTPLMFCAAVLLQTGSWNPSPPTHPDAFLQVPTRWLYFSYHFAGILLSVREIIFSHKQIKIHSRSPVCSLPRAALTASFYSPGSLRLPGNTG